MVSERILRQYQVAYDVINIILFDAELPRIWLGFIEDDEARKKAAKIKKGGFSPRTSAGEPMIYLSSSPQNGVIISDIDVLFHEMAHFYAYLNGINDVDKAKGLQYHTERFKDIIEEHGGFCRYTDSEFGYSDSQLFPGLLQKIEHVIINTLKRGEQKRNGKECKN